MGSGSPYFKFVGRRRSGVVVVKNVCGKCKVFPVSDWKDLKREADENGEFFENYLRDAMWNEMCVFCADVLKCKFASGLPNSPFDLFRIDDDTITRL